MRFQWLTWLTRNSRENTDGSKLLDSLSEGKFIFSKYDRSQANDLALAIMSEIIMCAFSG